MDNKYGLGSSKVAVELHKKKENMKCSNCEKPVMPHMVCDNCGFYKGKEVVKKKTKLDKNKK